MLMAYQEKKEIVAIGKHFCFGPAVQEEMGQFKGSLLNHTIFKDCIAKFTVFLFH